ncbi:hypothetical protein ACHAXN_006734 [Cyclotella atomus]
MNMGPVTTSHPSAFVSGPSRRNGPLPVPLIVSIRPTRAKLCRPILHETGRRDAADNIYKRILSAHGARQSPRKKMASACLSLVFSSFLLLGNFDTSMYYCQVLQNRAFALESASVDQISEGGSAQVSSWPPTSDQNIFKQPQSSDRVSSRPKRYWDVMQHGTADEMAAANEKLIDSAVATINTMYYDSSGGFAFDPKLFYEQWKNFRYMARNSGGTTDQNFPIEYENAFATRESTVKTLKWMVSTIGDPYSKYLTREELTQELVGGDDGFLGLGVLVDLPTATDNEFMKWSSIERPPDWKSILKLDKVTNRNVNGQWEGVSVDDVMAAFAKREVAVANQLRPKNKDILSVNQASSLPVIKAVVPDSPAERAGLVVGDRIASVGTYQFTGMSRPQVRKSLDTKFHAENYFGQADLTIAKPIVAAQPWDMEDESQEKYVFQDGWYQPKRSRPKVYENRRSQRVVAFKLSHVKSIPTTLTVAALNNSPAMAAPNDGAETTFPSVIGGDAIVHYATLTSNDSIFRNAGDRPVGYIRLTRFSKASTQGYINAINSLEAAGVDSYIIDLRNNYGGVIQEAMLTASTLLRDPHSVLCYTLNGRGGFRPQENMEYIIDKNYPGFFLSSEPKTVAIDQVRREHPEYLEDGWSSPTSYASLRELKETRGLKPAHAFIYNSDNELRTSMNTDDVFTTNNNRRIDLDKIAETLNRSSQKKIVILVNEGTASAAEVFASALHDNGRTVALVGTDTFGKGLIQHTFPMPDGGGLRLTVAEYLTPTLSHVTKIGGARYDSGIHPDVRCESKQGIPKNIGSDICVGVALDVLGN